MQRVTNRSTIKSSLVAYKARRLKPPLHSNCLQKLFANIYSYFLTKIFKEVEFKDGRFV